MELILTILPVASGIIGILQNSNNLYSFWKSNFSKKKSIPDFLSKEFSEEENVAIEKSLLVLSFSKSIVQIIFNKYLHKFFGIIIVFILLLILYFLDFDIIDTTTIDEYITMGIFSLVNYIICSPISNPFKLNFENILEDKNNIEKIKKKMTIGNNFDFKKIKLISKLDQEFLNKYYILSNLIYTLFTFKLKDIIETERSKLTEASQNTLRETFAFILKKLIEDKDGLKSRPESNDTKEIIEWESEQTKKICQELKLNGLDIFIDYFEGGSFFKTDFIKLNKEKKISQEIRNWW